jgi:hypothetical protein
METGRMINQSDRDHVLVNNYSQKLVDDVDPGSRDRPHPFPFKPKLVDSKK